MNVQQAAELAAEIDQTDAKRFCVLAVGRFLLADQAEQKAPFGISVRITGDERPTVIWNRREWESLLIPPSEASDPQPATRPDARHRSQPSLF